MNPAVHPEKKRRRSRYRFHDIPLAEPGSTPSKDIQVYPDYCGNYLSALECGTLDPTILNNVHILPQYGQQDICESAAPPQSSLADTSTAFEDKPIDIEMSPQAGSNMGMDFEPEDEECMDLTGSSIGFAQNNSADDAVAVSQSRRVNVRLQHWQALWGIVMTSGSQKMTKQNYQCMRTVADVFARLSVSPWTASDREITDCSWKNKIGSLPHFTTVQRKLKPILLNELAPRGKDYLEHVDMNKAGARCSTYSADGSSQIHVRTILPSEYARADIACGPVFEQMCSTGLENASKSNRNTRPVSANSSSSCVDSWPIIAARSWFYGLPSSVSVDDDIFSAVPSSFAERGYMIEISLLGSHSVHRSIRQLFEATREADYLKIRGNVLHLWTVHHEKRKDQPDFRHEHIPHLGNRQNKIVETLSFVSYTSPSDKVTVEIPNVPPQEVFDDEGDVADTQRTAKSKGKADADKERRAALKRRAHEIQVAWSSWTKPLLKPADVVVLIKPTRLERYQGCDPLLCLVNRVWAENEEQHRHVFWIPPEIDVFTVHTQARESAIRSLCGSFANEGNELYREVRSVALVSRHPGHRGPQKWKPVSSTGNLLTGEKYFIYRFVLFWDGFTIREGKNASGEGFYLMCLNLPLKARSSAGAVRVLSLVPPGVKPSAIFKLIQDDITAGMTHGFVDYDAQGEKRRIFLDLVGFLGDTPALNSVLDVLGHTASACCHLCSFKRRSETIAGSRYTQKDFHGCCSFASRNFYMHTAVRDSGAQKETCRLLGMKPPNANLDLPLHALRSAIRAVRHRIPKTSFGLPVLSGDLDPYKSCFVAPDHLMSGHARDCINTAFRLLPSKIHRTICEQYMIGCLSDCGLPTQNRLFDHEKKKLHSMSMTETFALIMVAEHALRKGFERAEALSAISTQSLMRDPCVLSIELVGSCARLMADLWYMPEEVHDGHGAVVDFNNGHGSNRINRLQAAASAHIALVQRLCSVSEAEIARTSDACVSKRELSALSRPHSTALRAMKTIDKPNIHRLLELFKVSLPMISYVGRLGELVLEKAHQPLKRAIKMSNNRNAHILAMASSAVDYWLARLTMLSTGALRGDSADLRGCFRLLAGREAIHHTEAQLSAQHAQQVLSALGPECCVPKLLEDQSRCVMSPRWDQSGNVTWELRGNLEVGQENSESLSADRLRAFRCLRSAYNFGLSLPPVTFGLHLHSTLERGLPGISLRVGTLLKFAAVTHGTYSSISLS